MDDEYDVIEDLKSDKSVITSNEHKIMKDLFFDSSASDKSSQIKIKKIFKNYTIFIILLLIFINPQIDEIFNRTLPPNLSVFKLMIKIILIVLLDVLIRYFV